MKKLLGLQSQISTEELSELFQLLKRYERKTGLAAQDVLKERLNLIISGKLPNEAKQAVDSKKSPAKAKFKDAQTSPLKELALIEDMPETSERRNKRSKPVAEQEHSV